MNLEDMFMYVVTGMLCMFSGPPTRYRLHHYYTRRKVDASKGDMLNETRKLLEDFYRPHNAEMYKLTDDKTFLYKY